MMESLDLNTGYQGLVKRKGKDGDPSVLQRLADKYKGEIDEFEEEERKI